MSDSGKPVVGSRVNQLDAAELDEEVFSLLKFKLNDAVKYVNVNLVASYEPEVKALLKSILYGFTLCYDGSTIGQRLLGLEYFASRGSLQRVTKKQTWVLVVLTVVLPWVKDRWLRLWLRRVPSQSRRGQIEWMVTWLEVTVQCASVVNFVLFLRNGVFHSLPTRLIGICNGHAVPQLLREVQYDHLNRELLWHGFAEFLAFLLPLVNYYRIKNIVKRATFLRRPKVPTRRNERTKSDFSSCAICRGPPVQPYEIGCRHVFCYFCIASNVTADSNFTCPSCNCTSGGMGNVMPASLPSKET